MKKGPLLGVVVAGMFFLSPSSPAAGQEEQELRGRITDDMCGGKHMMEGMTAKECADECVRMGSKYALYVGEEERLYALDAQEEARDFSGESVVVRGTLSEDGKTLHVTSIREQEN